MIEQWFLPMLGSCIPVALALGMWKANSRRWRRLAREYRVTGDLPSQAESRMQTLILVGGDIGWNSYKGITTVAVTPEGILLKLMPPFSAFHPPLLIPYSDLTLEPKRWYVIGETYQGTLSRVSDVQFYIDDKLVDWIKSEATSFALRTG